MTRPAEMRSDTPTYKTWVNMRRRCLDPKNKMYPYYGGRGIGICPSWNDYAAFFTDMGPCPVGLTLERIDNSLGYYKENCKWASMLEQANNRRNNIWMEHEGECKTLSQWAKAVGINRGTINTRYYSKWTPAQVLGFEPPPEAPPASSRAVLQYAGERIVAEYASAGDAAKHFGVTRTAIYMAICKPDTRACGFYWRYKA